MKSFQVKIKELLSEKKIFAGNAEAAVKMVIYHAKLVFPGVLGQCLIQTWTSLVAQMVKHLCTMWETWVRSLGWEDSLEKEMATHCTTLA